MVRKVSAPRKHYFRSPATFFLFGISCWSTSSYRLIALWHQTISGSLSGELLRHRSPRHGTVQAELLKPLKTNCKVLIRMPRLTAVRPVSCQAGPKPTQGPQKEMIRAHTHTHRQTKMRNTRASSASEHICNTSPRTLQPCPCTSRPRPHDAPKAVLLEHSPNLAKSRRQPWKSGHLLFKSTLSEDPSLPASCTKRDRGQRTCQTEQQPSPLSLAASIPRLSTDSKRDGLAITNSAQHPLPTRSSVKLQEHKRSVACKQH